MLVLCTFKPNEEGDFLLRVFTEKIATPKQGDMQDKSDEDVRKQGVKALFDRLAGDDNVIDVDELQDLMTFSLKKGTHAFAWVDGKGLTHTCVGKRGGNNSSVDEIEIATMGGTNHHPWSVILSLLPTLPFLSRYELPCLQLGGVPHHDLHAG